MLEHGATPDTAMAHVAIQEAQNGSPVGPLAVNDEVSLVVYDEGIARELEETFEADLKHAKEVDLENWKRRPVLHKLKDFTYFLFNEQL